MEELSEDEARVLRLSGGSTTRLQPADTASRSRSPSCAVQHHGCGGAARLPSQQRLHWAPGHELAEGVGDAVAVMLGGIGDWATVCVKGSPAGGSGAAKTAGSHEGAMVVEALFLPEMPEHPPMPASCGWRPVPPPATPREIAVMHPQEDDPSAPLCVSFPEHSPSNGSMTDCSPNEATENERCSSLSPREECLEAAEAKTQAAEPEPGVDAGNMYELWTADEHAVVRSGIVQAAVPREAAPRGAVDLDGQDQDAESPPCQHNLFMLIVAAVLTVAWLDPYVGASIAAFSQCRAPRVIASAGRRETSAPVFQVRSDSLVSSAAGPSLPETPRVSNLIYTEHENTRETAKMTGELRLSKIAPESASQARAVILWSGSCLVLAAALIAGLVHVAQDKRKSMGSSGRPASMRAEEADEDANDPSWEGCETLWARICSPRKVPVVRRRSGIADCGGKISDEKEGVILQGLIKALITHISCVMGGAPLRQLVGFSDKDMPMTTSADTGDACVSKTNVTNDVDLGPSCANGNVRPLPVGEKEEEFHDTSETLCPFEPLWWSTPRPSYWSLRLPPSTPMISSLRSPRTEPFNRQSQCVPPGTTGFASCSPRSTPSSARSDTSLFTPFSEHVAVPLLNTPSGLSSLTSPSTGNCRNMSASAGVKRVTNLTNSDSRIPVCNRIKLTPREDLDLEQQLDRLPPAGRCQTAEERGVSRSKPLRDGNPLGVGWLHQALDSGDGHERGPRGGEECRRRRGARKLNLSPVKLRSEEGERVCIDALSDRSPRRSQGLAGGVGDSGEVLRKGEAVDVDSGACKDANEAPAQGGSIGVGGADVEAVAVADLSKEESERRKQLAATPIALPAKKRLGAAPSPKMQALPAMATHETVRAGLVSAANAPPLPPPPPPPPPGDNRKEGIKQCVPPPPPPPPDGLRLQRCPGVDGGVPPLVKSWDVIKKYQAMQRSLNQPGGAESGAVRQHAAGRRRKETRGTIASFTGCGQSVRAGRCDGKQVGPAAGGLGGLEGKHSPLMSPSQANGQGELSVKEELENKSAYMRQVMADRRQYKDMLLALTTQIEAFEPENTGDVEEFMIQLEQRLALLSDERTVLKAFVRWPEARVEAMREAVGRVHELRKLEESFANVRVEDKGLRALDEAVDVAVKRLKTVGPALEALQRQTHDLRRQFAAHGIPLDLPGLEHAVKRAGVELCARVLQALVRQEANLTANLLETRMASLGLGAGSTERRLLEKAVDFAFRMHQFAGGFDAKAETVFVHAFAILERCCGGGIETR